MGYLGIRKDGHTAAEINERGWDHVEMKYIKSKILHNGS